MGVVGLQVNTSDVISTEVCPGATCLILMRGEVGVGGVQRVQTSVELNWNVTLITCVEKVQMVFSLCPRDQFLIIICIDYFLIIIKHY